MRQLLLITHVYVFAIVCVFTVFSAEAMQWPSECDGKPPHYLVGLSQPKDQIDKFHQIVQVADMSRADSNGRALWGANLGEKVDLTFYGHTVVLYLPMYRRVDNVVYFQNTAGVTRLTEQEFLCVKADLAEWIQTGIDADYKDYEMVTEGAVENFAKRVGKTPSEVKAMLAQTIPEYGVTYGDVLKIPLLQPVDFIKGIRHIYFTPMQSCNAAVFIKTILAFTPCVRRTDFVLGHNETIKHELIHANTKLQGYPIVWYINGELDAALLPFLEYPPSLQTFFYHGYLSTPWEALKVFGCFDVMKVREEIYRYRVPMGGSALNQEALQKYLPAINEAARWLRESAVKVLAEFYADPHMWAVVNQIFYDDDMAYKVLMAKSYEPVLIDCDHGKTSRFILKHAEESKEVAAAAMKKVGEPRRTSQDERRSHMLRELSVLAEAMGFTQERLQSLGQAYGITAQSFEAMNPETIRQILRDYLDQQGPFTHLKEVR